MYGALDQDGETYANCRLGILGKPASVVLYVWLPDEKRWRSADTLLRATVVEHPDGSMTMEGESQELVNVVGLPPEDARVRWEVEVIGCPDCN